MYDLFGLGIPDKCSGRNAYYHILGVCTVELASRAVAAGKRDKFALVAESKQSIAAGVNAENNVSAPSAVAAVRSAVRDVFFTSEGDGSVTAVSRLDVYFYSVNKHLSDPF